MTRSRAGALRALRSFLPPTILGLHGPARRPAVVPAEIAYDATLLMSDISGFTALTERLEARGKEGAEEIARLVNAVFRPAVGVVDSRRGSILGFAGDSLLALFEGADAPVRAREAAVGVRAALAELVLRTSVGPLTPRVASAIATGPVRERHLGDDVDRLVLLEGATVRRLAALEARARPGDVLSIRVRREGRSGRPATVELLPEPPPLDAATGGAYLPPHLRRLLRRSRREIDLELEGRYVRPSILFLETRSRTLLAQQTLFVELRRSLVATGGLLLKTDPSPEGSRFLCLFGIPAAHEDDPDRAARSALDLLATTGTQARAAIHAGSLASLVIGAGQRRTLDVMGDAVNLAARALGRAPWGGVVVTEALRRQLGGRVTTRDLGRHDMKGKGQPVRLHLLEESRASRAPLRTGAPLVGRQREMRRLAAELDGARRGEGRTIAIVGDAGLGKSRLKWEMAREARRRGFGVAEAAARPFGGRPLDPIRDLAAAALGPARSDEGAPARLRRVSGLGSETRRTLSWLLEISNLGRAPSRQSHGERLAPALRQLFLAVAARAPWLVVLEDLHWADVETVAVVEELARRPPARCAVVVLQRPGRALPATIPTLELGLLGEGEVREMLDAGRRGGEVSPELAGLIAERSGGNPFYVEELARHFEESGLTTRESGSLTLSRPPRPEELPASIESLLSMRLHRLSPLARRVAEIGAAMGRYFPVEVVARIVGPELAGALRELEEREIAFVAGGAGQRIVFKHALVRDVAYDSVLRATRRRLHREIARAMEAGGAGRATDAVARAHHWEQAGDRERAAAGYREAARSAVQRSSYREAEAPFRAALRCTRGRRLQEVRNELGSLLQILGRRDEARQLHARALSWGRRHGDAGVELEALSDLGDVARAAGRLGQAEDHYRRARVLGRMAGERHVEANLGERLALCLAARGRLADAHRVLRGAFEIHRRGGNPAPASVTLANLANLEQERGDFVRSRRSYEGALELARAAGARRVMATALGNLAILECHVGDMQGARRLQVESLALHRRMGSGVSVARGTGNLGYILDCSGDQAGARRLYRRSLRTMARIQDLPGMPRVLINLAALEREEGRPRASLRLASRALEIAREIQDLRLEGSALVGVAQAELDLGASPRTVVATLRRGERILKECADLPEVVQAICARGHAELRAGGNARAALQEARRVLAPLRAGRTSFLRDAIARLAEAIRCRRP